LKSNPKKMTKKENQVGRELDKRMGRSASHVVEGLKEGEIG
jgi:hypothetical protein